MDLGVGHLERSSIDYVECRKLVYAYSCYSKGVDMSHLKDINENYFQHLWFAWRVSFVLFVHGMFPFIWEEKATNMMLERSIVKIKKPSK